MRNTILFCALALLATSSLILAATENVNIICTFTTCDSCTRHPECFWCSDQNRCHASDATFRCNHRFSIFKPNQCVLKTVPQRPVIPSIPTPTPRLDPIGGEPSTPIVEPSLPTNPTPSPSPIPSPVPSPSGPLPMPYPGPSIPTTITTCFSQASTDPNVCSGRGVCVAHDTCQCKSGFNGDRCNGVESARSCDPGYSGENCNVPLCFSQEASDPNVCNGRGVCSAPNTCKCHTGFSGERCEIGNGGIAAGSTSNSCSFGFTGVSCDIPLCFSQPANDPNVCSGKGRCTAPDTCSCTNGYSGDRCQTSPGF